MIEKREYCDAYRDQSIDRRTKRKRGIDIINGRANSYNELEPRAVEYSAYTLSRIIPFIDDICLVNANSEEVVCLDHLYENYLNYCSKHDMEPHTYIVFATIFRQYVFYGRYLDGLLMGFCKATGANELGKPYTKYVTTFKHLEVKNI